MRKLMFLSALLFTHFAWAQGTETRQVDEFTKLDVGGSFDVEIEQGSKNEVRIEAKGVDPDKIITEMKGDELRVYMKRGNYNNIRTTVYITYTEDLEAISNSGSGNMICKSAFSASDFSLSNSGSGNLESKEGIKADHFSFDLSGSGNVELASVDTDEFSVSMSGSGNLSIDSGSANQVSINKSGSGDMKAYDVKSDNCAVNMSGSGNVSISVNKTLNGVLSGSADLDYQGDATVSSVQVSGSGRVNKH